MCGWQGGWRHFGGAIFEIGWKRRAVGLTEAEVRARGCGHIVICHSPAYVFVIAMPLQPSFRLAPESGVVISYYSNGADKHRFRLAPE